MCRVWGRWRGAGRLVRARGHGPARLADRSVQPALQLLHAGEGLDWLPGPRCSPTTSSSAWSRSRSQALGITEVRLTGGEPLLRRGLPGWWRTAALWPRPEISLTTNGIGLARLAGPLRAGRAGPAQRVPGHAVTARCSRAGPARPASRRPGRPGRRGRRRAGPGQGEHGAHARRQRSRGRGAAAVLPGARLPAPVHRADAAGRPARLAAVRHGHRRRDLGRACRPSSRSPRTTRPAGDPRPPRPSWSTAARPGSA